jgi:hypothetical protein
MDKNDTILGIEKKTCLKIAIGMTVAGLVLLLVIIYFNRKKEGFKNEKIVKRFNTVSDDDKTLLVHLYPDTRLRQQLDDNYGQLQRLTILIERTLQNMTGNLYQINEIHVHSAIPGDDFEVDKKVYPKKTYALFRFQKKGQKKHVNIPLTFDPEFGDGLEELIYSQITQTLPEYKSNIQQIL